MRRRPQILLLFLLAVILTVAVALIPNIISEEVRALGEQYLGPHYVLILFGILILSAAVLLYISNYLSAAWPGSTRRRLDQLTIPWSLENEEHIRLARQAIREDDLKGALQSLFDIDQPALNDEATLLARRLSEYHRDDWQGTQAPDTQSRAGNRLGKDILQLIKAVEDSLAEESKINSTIKDYLRQRYTHRLEQKLASRQPINLNVAPSSEGTSEATSSYFVTLNNEDVQGEILKIFSEARGRLLITGAPGAGKTVVMLQLVSALLEEKLSAIPVLLNLASWNSSFVKLEVWLEKILPSELGVNNALGKKVIEEIPLILLLDGLDEVAEDARQSCLEAIGAYGANAQHQFVIATRRQEYVEVAKDAPVFLQIEVEPLQIEQIKAELRRIGYEQPEALPLLQAIESDDTLHEVVKTPFYFNLLQLLFAQGLRMADLPSRAQTPEEREKEIVAFFLSRELGEGKEQWPQRDAQHWLSFLASRMVKNNSVVFELVDMQYDWLSPSAGRKHSMVVSAGLLSGLLKGLSLGIAFGVSFSIVLMLFSVFVFGLLLRELNTLDEILWLGLSESYITPSLLGVGIGVANGLGDILLNWNTGDSLPQIFTKDSIHWSQKKYLSTFKSSLIIGVILGAIFGIQADLLTSILGGFFFGMLVGVMGILVSILFDLFQEEHSAFMQISTPYQRFTASVRNLHFSILQHLHLRYLLYKKGLLPWRLVDFLNYCTEQHILESDGATWRFRHRILQDYFAEQWAAEHGEEEE